MTIANSISVALGTLASAKALLTAGPTMTRGGRLLSVRGSYVVHSLTAGDGPLLFGIADKSLSLVQLEEYLELQGPVTPDAVPEREQSSRGAQIRTLGILQPQADGTTASQYLSNVSMSGLKFSEEAAGWNYWVYNPGQSMTTGSTLAVTVQFFAEFNASG